MPSSKDPVINRQKAKEYRLAHPEWHRRKTREWMRKKRARNGSTVNAQIAKKYKDADPVGYILGHAERRAKLKDIPFNLTRDDIVVPEFCPVLGIKLEFGIGAQGWRNMNSPSLDKIKPQLGYVSGNVRVISNRANHLKSNGTISEFEAVLAYMKRESCNYDLSEQEAGLPERLGSQETAQIAWDF